MRWSIVGPEGVPYLPARISQLATIRYDLAVYVYLSDYWNCGFYRVGAGAGDFGAG